MLNIHRLNKKKLVIGVVFLTCLLAEGCDNQEDGKEHLQKGIEYLNKGEYEKAKLELETSSQSNKDTAQTYYYLALLDEKNRQFKSMKENLLKTIELAPNHTEARIKLGSVLLLLSEPAKAQEQADFILKDSPQNVQAMALKASVLINQKKAVEASVLLDDILKTKPENPDALSLKALVAAEKNDMGNALALIDKAIKADPKNIAFQMFKIQIHAKAKDMDAVVSDYQTLISLYPDDTEFKVTLAKIYTQMEKKTEAEAVLRKLIDQFPEDVRPKLLLLDFLATISTEKTVGQFRQFVDKHKAQPKMLLDFANWMMVRKNFDEANSVLNQIIASGQDADASYMAKMLLAKNALEVKNYEVASKAVDEILEAKPDDYNAKILKARLFMAKQLPDEAMEILNKLTWSNPNSDEAWYLLGQSQLIKGKKPEADKNFIKALELNPANFDALVYVYDEALATHDIKYAKGVLKKALALKPDNLVLLEKLAKINLFDRNWSEAQLTVQQIEQVANPIAKDLASYLQGQIFQGQGDCTKAIQIYKALLAKYPENSDALASLGGCYESTHKRGEMIAFLSDAWAKNPKNIAAGVVLAELYALDKNFDKSASLLANLIQKAPNIPRFYALLANVQLAKNDKKAAAVAYREGLEKNPESVELSLSLASLYENQGQHDLAAGLYEQLIVKHPLLDMAVNNLAVILGESPDKGQLAKAVRLAEKFKDSEQNYFKDTYAWLLIKQDRIADGLNILSQIVAAVPNEPIFRYHLGVAYYKDGNPSLASSELKQALELAKAKGDFADEKAVVALLDKIAKSGH
jgi:tetratricopeptide (TPR) repeat protein